MSYYYNYYIGYKSIDSPVIKPYGPFTCEGKFKPIIKKSRSFASNLYKDFLPIEENQISLELRKEFEYEDWQGKKQINLKYLPLKDFLEGDYIIKGYFLIEDVKNWEEGNISTDELLYNMISPFIYAEKLKKEIIFGKNESKKDIEGEEYIEPNASDYVYYAVPDYNSKEYEAWVIRKVVDMLYDYNFFHEKEIIILETEG